MVPNSHLVDGHNVAAVTTSSMLLCGQGCRSTHAHKQTKPDTQARSVASTRHSTCICLMSLRPPQGRNDFNMQIQPLTPLTTIYKLIKRGRGVNRFKLAQVQEAQACHHSEVLMCLDQMQLEQLYVNEVTPYADLRRACMRRSSICLKKPGRIGASP